MHFLTEDWGKSCFKCHFPQDFSEQHLRTWQAESQCRLLPVRPEMLGLNMFGCCQWMRRAEEKYKAPCVPSYANLFSSQRTGAFICFSWSSSELPFPSGSLLSPVPLLFLPRSSSKKATRRRAWRQPGMSPHEPQLQGRRTNNILGKPDFHIPSLGILFSRFLRDPLFPLWCLKEGSKGWPMRTEQPCTDCLFWCCSDQSCYGQHSGMSIVPFTNKGKAEIATYLMWNIKILPNEGFAQPAWMTLLEKLKKGNDDSANFFFPDYLCTWTHIFKKGCFSRKKRNVMDTEFLKNYCKKNCKNIVRKNFYIYIIYHDHKNNASNSAMPVFGR